MIAMNYYSTSPDIVFEDREKGKEGKLEMWNVFNEEPHAHLVVLTRVTGYGTTRIAKRMDKINTDFMLKHDVGEIVTIHNWAAATGHSLEAKSILYSCVRNPLMKARSTRILILCGNNGLKLAAEAGLVLAGVKRIADVFTDEVAFMKEVRLVLQRGGSKLPLSVRKRRGESVPPPKRYL